MPRFHLQVLVADLGFSAIEENRVVDKHMTINIVAKWLSLRPSIVRRQTIDPFKL